MCVAYRYTGNGNARYWVLKMMIEELPPGSKTAPITTVVYNETSRNGTNPFCAVESGSSNWQPGQPYVRVELACVDPNAVIDSIDFAGWGLPEGLCGAFAPGTCDSPTTSTWAKSLCVGNNSCLLDPLTALGDPCLGMIKTLKVQARCSGNQGGTGRTAKTLGDIYAQAFVTHSDGARKILVVSTVNTATMVVLPNVTIARVALVDASVADTFSCQDNCVRYINYPPTDGFYLGSYGTAIVTLHNDF